MKSVKILDLSEWDELVSKTYGRVYSFQQQDGCKGRETVYFSVPHTYPGDNGMHDSIPEVVNGEEMGVKFAVWLARDPMQPIPNQKHGYQLELFWERNFYPDFGTVVNDLHEKGLIEAGEYGIDIDW